MSLNRFKPSPKAHEDFPDTKYFVSGGQCRDHRDHHRDHRDIFVWDPSLGRVPALRGLTRTGCVSGWCFCVGRVPELRWLTRAGHVPIKMVK